MLVVAATHQAERRVWGRHRSAVLQARGAELEGQSYLGDLMNYTCLQCMLARGLINQESMLVALDHTLKFTGGHSQKPRVAPSSSSSRGLFIVDTFQSFDGQLKYGLSTTWRGAIVGRGTFRRQGRGSHCGDQQLPVLPNRRLTEDGLQPVLRGARRAEVEKTLRTEREG